MTQRHNKKRKRATFRRRENNTDLMKVGGKRALVPLPEVNRHDFHMFQHRPQPRSRKT